MHPIVALLFVAYFVHEFYGHDISQATLFSIAKHSKLDDEGFEVSLQHKEHVSFYCCLSLLYTAQNEVSDSENSILIKYYTLERTLHRSGSVIAGVQRSTCLLFWSVVRSTLHFLYFGCMILQKNKKFYYKIPKIFSFDCLLLSGYCVLKKTCSKLWDHIPLFWSVFQILQDLI